MIVEIALGIVLAVLILRFLGVILMLVVAAIGIAIALAVLALLIYLATTYPEIFVAAVGGIAAIGGAVYWEAKRIEKEEASRKANPPTLEDPADTPKG